MLGMKKKLWYYYWSGACAVAATGRLKKLGWGIWDWNQLQLQCKPNDHHIFFFYSLDPRDCLRFLFCFCFGWVSCLFSCSWTREFFLCLCLCLCLFWWWSLAKFVQATLKLQSPHKWQPRLHFPECKLPSYGTSLQRIKNPGKKRIFVVFFKTGGRRASLPAGVQLVCFACYSLGSFFFCVQTGAAQANENPLASGTVAVCSSSRIVV